METIIVFLIFTTLGVFLIPFIVPLFKIPVAVGELLFGILLSFFFTKFGLKEEVSFYIDFLSFLGFSVLMFLAGLEIDWNKLETLKGREKAVITAVVLSNFLLSLLAVKVLDLNVQTVFLTGALGIGLMITVLREIPLEEQKKQVILITGSLGEILTLLGLTFYDLYLSFGLGKLFYIHLGLIALFGFLFAVLLKLIKLLIWYFPEKVASLIVEESKAAIDIRASFALMLLFMAFSSLIHVEPILGAFIAGILLGFIFRQKEHFEKKMASLGYGFLIPFFFLQVGFSFNLSSLTGMFLKLTLILAAVLTLVKILSSVWFKFLNFTWREVLLTGLLFSFPFTILIAEAKILHEKGVWSDGDFAVAVILTLITSVVYPFLAKLIAPSGERT
jgi:Kef-type K+ transport system membrane component KefB